MARSMPIRDLSQMSTKSVVTSQPTPAAALHLLAEAEGGPLALALCPYIGCGRVGEQPTAEPRLWQQLITPGVVHVQLAVGRQALPVGIAVGLTDNAEATSATGGTTGNDIVQIVMSGGTQVLDVCDPTGQPIQPVVSSPTIQDSPTATQPRQLEVVTASAPALEQMSLDRATSVSVLTSSVVADIEAL